MMQLVQLIVRERFGAVFRMDTRTVQRLIYINIADADDIFLIKQQRFNFGAFT
ncbi:hypothetical protein D3C81_2043240 [compost metagenome]